MDLLLIFNSPPNNKARKVFNFHPWIFLTTDFSQSRAREYSTEYRP